jgi:hypothetical protein
MTGSYPGSLWEYRKLSHLAVNQDAELASLGKLGWEAYAISEYSVWLKRPVTPERYPNDEMKWYPWEYDE